MIQRYEVSLDTLLILIRKATARVKKYEALRNDLENTVADRMLPEMFELRKDLRQAYLGSLKAKDPEDQPPAEVMDRAQLLLRALAPGIRRPASTRELKSLSRRRRAKATEDTDTVVTGKGSESRTHGTRTRSRRRKSPDGK
jgi:hypothetical protein